MKAAGLPLGAGVEGVAVRLCVGDHQLVGGWSNVFGKTGRFATWRKEQRQISGR